MKLQYLCLFRFTVFLVGSYMFFQLSKENVKISKIQQNRKDILHSRAKKKPE